MVRDAVAKRDRRRGKAPRGKDYVSPDCDIIDSGRLSKTRTSDKTETVRTDVTHLSPPILPKTVAQVTSPVHFDFVWRIINNWPVV